MERPRGEGISNRSLIKPHPRVNSQDVTGDPHETGLLIESSRNPNPFNPNPFLIYFPATRMKK